jgi:xylose isomerase
MRFKPEPKPVHPTELERDEAGRYVDAIGAGGLNANQQKAIRKVLAEAHEALMIGSICGKAGIALTTPGLQQSASQFIGEYLVSTKEAQRHAEWDSRSGREVFRGYVGTDHLRSLIERGLP